MYSVAAWHKLPAHLLCILHYTLRPPGGCPAPTTERDLQRTHPRTAHQPQRHHWQRALLGWGHAGDAHQQAGADHTRGWPGECLEGAIHTYCITEELTTPVGGMTIKVDQACGRPGGMLSLLFVKKMMTMQAT
eukprot:scaffold195078_cov19-Tisochrysis_lutea.AAC.1